MIGVMILIVGLGNNDKKFDNTRHNIGFFVVKKFIQEEKLNDLALNKKLDALISINNDLILALPQCFMNESGKIIKKLVQYFKIDLDSLLIIHDDTDLQLGKFKIQKNRGSAGHKGVESLINYLKSRSFWRLRIGVRSPHLKDKKAIDLVLKKFTAEEKKMILDLWPAIHQNIKNFINQKQK
jgi:PTH1 family peptidyl-tRNA hydrolase